MCKNNNDLRIAFIDDGILKNKLSKKIPIENYIVQNGTVDREKNPKNSLHSHATTCASIFLKYVDFDKWNIFIVSLEILHEKMQGSVDDLITAIEWACDHNIKLINISAGIIYYKVSLRLRECINCVSKKGAVIVAAQNNNGWFTYPASFSNVIGVNAIKNSCNEFIINQSCGFDGIEFSAKAVHELAIYEKEKHVTSNSDSFAAPYVSALIANLYKDVIKSNVTDVKYDLCHAFKLDFSGICSLNIDWCQNALIIYLGKININISMLNFQIAEELIVSESDDLNQMIYHINKKQEQLHCETIIFIYSYYQYNNIMDFVGLFNCFRILYIDVTDVKENTLFTAQTRITASHIQLPKDDNDNNYCDIDIPVIVFCSDDVTGMCEILYEIREGFQQDGFNCKAMINKNIGILYEFFVFHNQINSLYLHKLIQIECIDIVMIGILNNFDFSGLEYDIMFKLDSGISSSKYITMIKEMFEIE